MRRPKTQKGPKLSKRAEWKQIFDDFHRASPSNIARDLELILSMHEGPPEVTALVLGTLLASPTGSASLAAAVLEVIRAAARVLPSPPATTEPTASADQSATPEPVTVPESADANPLTAVPDPADPDLIAVKAIIAEHRNRSRAPSAVSFDVELGRQSNLIRSAAYADWSIFAQLQGERILLRTRSLLGEAVRPFDKVTAARERAWEQFDEEVEQHALSGTYGPEIQALAQGAAEERARAARRAGGTP